MANLSPLSFFRQSLKSDAYYADEIINIYLLRPLAAFIVWLLYPTGMTPNQVTIVAVVLGLCSAVAFAVGSPASLVWAGILIIAKDIFDDADGQLARAKEMYSRRGRFIDSIGDFVVDVAVFAGLAVSQSHAVPLLPVTALSVLGLAGITMRVSYHVFYQVSFLHLEDKYTMNRIVEAETDEDRRGDPVALRLQRIFNLIYGRQDRLMFRIDAWCKGGNFDERLNRMWYSDRLALRLSGLMGFGTELAILGICAMTNNLFIYLIINVVVMNLVWVVNIFYRKLILSANLK